MRCRIEMPLHGKIAANLRAAIRSARRLRGHPVHRDTLQFWSDLLAYAKARKRDFIGGDRAAVEALIARLQGSLVDRDTS